MFATTPLAYMGICSRNNDEIVYVDDEGLNDDDRESSNAPNAAQIAAIKEIKNNFIKLRNETTKRLNAETERAKREIASMQSAEDVDSFVDDIFKGVEEEFLSRLKAIKEEVKTHAPKNPQEKDCRNKKAFEDACKKHEDDLSDYKEYIAHTAGVMIRLKEFLRDFSKFVELG